MGDTLYDEDVIANMFYNMTKEQLVYLKEVLGSILEVR